MKERITKADLETAARKCGLTIQHECSGYRIVREEGIGRRDVFPSGGVCPVESKRACMGFLYGVEYERKNREKKDC